MQTTLEGILFVAVCLALTVLAMFLARRIFARHTLTAHEQAAGHAFAMTGTMCAVILAFAVITVWDQYQDSKSVSDSEANALDGMYRLANGFPEPAQGEIQQAILNYAQTVIDEEWPAMAAETAPGPRTSQALERLYEAYERPEVATASNAELYAASLSQLHDVSANRTKRLLDSHGGLPGIMWIALLGASLLTIGLALLFDVEDARMQATIVGALSTTIALLLFVTYVMNHPFRGGFHLQPNGLRLLLQQFRT